MDDQALAQFSAITGASPDTARGALQAANGSLEEAVSLYYASQEAEPEDDDVEDDEPAHQPTSATPAQPTHPTQSSSRTNRRPPGQRPKHMTLGDLQRGEADDEDEEKDRYAGGEKSGLAVEQPGRGPGGAGAGGAASHFQNIMQQARANRDRPAGEDDEDEEEGAQGQTARQSNFMGRAQTLGGDDAPSRVIADPNAPPTQGAGAGAGAVGRQRLPKVTRTMHLWADGVSIDDGPLFRFDDPANQDIMTQINQGRAPLSLLDVQPDQEVDLNLDPHQGENYVQPKKVYKPFGGSGQRLGAPTPGPSSSSATTTFSQPAPAAASSSATQKPAEMQVDDATPTLQLQIRLGDGTRLSSRFNTTHTIGDVYDFVTRASADSAARQWVLMTTFPSKELDDKSQVLGEMSDFKRGGVVVQKWK